MDLKHIQKFLYESTSSSYANTDVKIHDEKDGSHTIIHSEGDLTLHDNYFGGEPFGGRLVIFEKNSPVWMMVYYGSVENNSSDFKGVYKFLREALSNNSLEMPYRGPEKYEKEEWLYTNELLGDFSSYSGIEKIFYKGDLVYLTRYQGGQVNVRKE